jgi:hypothetical protein
MRIPIGWLCGAAAGFPFYYYVTSKHQALYRFNNIKRIDKGKDEVVREMHGKGLKC